MQAPMLFHLRNVILVSMEMDLEGSYIILEGHGMMSIIF